MILVLPPQCSVALEHTWVHAPLWAPPCSPAVKELSPRHTGSCSHTESTAHGESGGGAPPQPGGGGIRVPGPWWDKKVPPRSLGRMREAGASPRRLCGGVIAQCSGRAPGRVWVSRSKPGGLEGQLTYFPCH